MEALELARWQFGITTVYHFFFVPITIGLSLLVAIMQMRWMQTRDEQWLRLTKFFGKLFTINFALGLVTGIVQEFQFGMNWSDYSRFVGDIFGAPLAFEALLAFFLESTFLGLWIFGWGRIPEKLHAACIWLVHIGTVLSAYFILAANSFMQNPVGYEFNAETGRAEMSDFLAVLTNKVQLVTFPHVITSAYMTGGAFVLAIALWHLWRSKHGDGGVADDRRRGYANAAKLGAITVVIAALGVFISGDLQGKVMTEVQPMKMAAAEAHYETSTSAPFSVFSTGNLDGTEAKHWITVPGLLSYLGKGDFNAEIEGIHNLEADYAAKWGAQGNDPLPNGYVVDDFKPNIPVTYWTFRLMMGLGFLAFGLGILYLIWQRRRGFAGSRFWWLTAVTILFMPLFANSFGWIFTEMGRQPWIVYGLMPTAAGVSPGVTAGEVWASLIIFTLLYGGLAVIEVALTIKYAKAGTEAFEDEDAADLDPGKRDADAPFVFTY